MRGMEEEEEEKGREEKGEREEVRGREGGLGAWFSGRSPARMNEAPRFDS